MTIDTRIHILQKSLMKYCYQEILLIIGISNNIFYPFEYSRTKEQLLFCSIRLCKKIVRLYFLHLRVQILINIYVCVKLNN